MKMKTCTNCLLSYTPTGRCQKYCKECGETMRLEKMKERHRSTYQKKGYAQFGEANNNWKGGIGIYRRLLGKTSCDRCKSNINLLVHHVDGNRYNNQHSNLECLCKRCHQKEHNCEKQLPQGITLSALKKNQAKNAKRDSCGKFSK